VRIQDAQSHASEQAGGQNPATDGGARGGRCPARVLWLTIQQDGEDFFDLGQAESHGAGSGSQAATPRRTQFDASGQLFAELAVVLLELLDLLE
jgi:hypothetical protein